MNEQFEKLKKMAVDHANEVIDYRGKDYSEIVMEKFAELIVRECADNGVMKNSLATMLVML